MIRKFCSNIVRSLREVTLPVWTEWRTKKVHAPLSGRHDGLVVSLTTFPARIRGLWIVLDSLFRQTIRPDVIVLALAEDEFPSGIADIPDSVRRFVPLGVEIVFLPYNMRPHNKYSHAFRAYPDATVITVDDDCCYAPDTIARLVELNRLWPEAVCCNIAAIIDPGHFYEYSFWKKSSSRSAPDTLNVALGFAGVLYPKGLSRGRFLESDLAMKLSPTADDLWLKAVELVEGVKVASGDFFPKPVTIKSSQKVSLRKLNKGVQNRNDRQWEALDEYFKLKEKI